MPSNTSRSSSISSASTRTSKADGPKKKFCCSFPACGKSFSRSEHLHRHALNHKDGNNTCLRCSAHFRRRDLLDRHMLRHKEKDDEAGGEGLGVLATRKRLWKDASGNIINARRPSYPQEGAKRRQVVRDGREGVNATADEEKKIVKDEMSTAPLPSPTRTMSRDESLSSTIVVDTGVPGYTLNEIPRKLELQDDSWIDMNTLPSPPMSENSIQSASRTPSTDLGELDGLYEESWQLMQESPSQIGTHGHDVGQSELLGNPNWGCQPFQIFMGAAAELPYEDIFKPEASMYDWQHWNSQVLMSKCREEKYDPYEERKREWATSYYGQPGNLQKAYGLGMG